MYYSKSTGGFYDENIHGKLTIERVERDPETGEIVNQWQERNPNCLIPLDAVEVAAEEHVALLAAQSAGKVIRANQKGGPVAVDPPKPTAAQVWGAIKAERERRKAGGVKIGDKWFHSDDASRIQQLGLVMMGEGLPAGLQWKTMDGSFITMTPALAQQVFTRQATSDQTIFAVAEQHRVAMEASADPAAYDFSTGWPKTYAEFVSE